MPSPIPLPPHTAQRHGFDPFTPIVNLLPLPQETYPRVLIPPKRDMGYYLALCLVLSIWSITPLSYVYLICFAGLVSRTSGGARVAAIIFAVWAFVEAVFAIYYLYLIYRVQTPAPSHELSIERRNELFHKVLQVGMSTTRVERMRDLRPVDTDISHRLLDETNNEHEKSSPVDLGKSPSLDKRQQAPTGGLDHIAGKDFWHHISERTLRAEGTSPTSGYKAEQPGTFILDPRDERAIEFRERLRTWFNHAPWESLRKDNVLTWLAWLFYDSSLSETQKDNGRMMHLKETLTKIEDRTGSIIPEGFDPNIPNFTVTLEPVKARIRPFLLYALTGTINAWLQNVVYPFRGWTMHKDGDFEYLVHIPSGWAEQDQLSRGVPVVYLQGLGFGLLHSYALIKQLNKLLPGHPILLPLSPHSSQSLFNRRHLNPWRREELVSNMKRTCGHLGFWQEGNGDTLAKGGVSIISHSNGSIAHCWIMKDCPEMTKRNTLVDPVVLCQLEGDITYAFCYRRPTMAKELILYYLIATEVGIAHYIRRHFHWTDNTLFFSEIPNALDPRRTAFFLGGKDIIIDAARTRKYLEDHGVTAQSLHYDAEASHGDGLEGESRTRALLYAGTGSTRGWTGWSGSDREPRHEGRRDLESQQV